MTTDEIFNEFYRRYYKIYTKRAKRLCHALRVAPFVHEDCVQAAMFRVYQSIHGWDPTKSSLYTYTYLGARKAMLCIVREYHSNKAYSSKPLVRFIVGEQDIEWKRERDMSKYVDTAREQEDKYLTSIYLRDLIEEERQRDPKRLQRFLTFALDGANMATLARESKVPVSQQVYFNGVVHTRKALRKKARIHCG